MNFNFILYTGDTTVTGSSQNIFHYNQLGILQEDYTSSSYVLVDSDGNIKDNKFHFYKDVITGSYSSLISLNSQTLLEGGFDITTGRNKYYYTIDASGNYIIDIENSDNKIIFDSNLTLGNTDVVYYDRRDFGTGIAVYKTDTGVSMNTAVADLYNAVDSAYNNLDSPSDLFDLYDVFFNGQKIQDGEYPDALSTGMLFAIPAKTGVIRIDTGSADIYGYDFVEHHIDFYLNGLEQDRRDFMQLYTGVYMIETGIPCSITPINLETETYSI